MKKMNQEKTDLVKELEQIQGRLKELKKIHGDSLEVVYMSSVYGNDRFLAGKEYVSIINVKNYSFYKKCLDWDKERKQERIRFQDLKHLKEFRVVCIDETISPEAATLFHKGQHDWLDKGKVYVCIGMKQSIDGYSLILKNTAENGGEELRFPSPFEGYSSIRFDIFNYTTYN